ncbi:hypothetical protein GC177_08575 [bacterium]|nr:hypothetical protein [bacterium]
MAWLITFFSEKEDAQAFLASEDYRQFCQQPDNALVTLTHDSDDEMNHEYAVFGELKPDATPIDVEALDDWLMQIEDENDASMAFISEKPRDKVVLDF